MRAVSLALALAMLAGPALAVPPASTPPVAVPTFAAGPPAAGSGSPGQLYFDSSAHAGWLNIAGTWTQYGIFTAPTASPIPPPATTHTYLATTGGNFLTTTGGSEFQLQ